MFTMLVHYLYPDCPSLCRPLQSPALTLARAAGSDSSVPWQVPLIGFIGRLDYQKGADLVLGVVPWLMEQDVQLVCLGTGDVSLEVGTDPGPVVLGF